MLKTDRLILREWKESDLEEFAKINADKRVCEFLPSVMRYGESNKFAYNIIEHFKKHGFGFWAVELSGTGRFIGFIGLRIPSFETHFTPCVEMACRLGYEHWGKGLATEGAKSALDYGFGHLNLDEIVSFAPIRNIKAIHLMEKLGMTNDPDDNFAHPYLPQGHLLSMNVLYRLSKDKWLGLNKNPT